MRQVIVIALVLPSLATVPVYAADNSANDFAKALAQYQHGDFAGAVNLLKSVEPLVKARKDDEASGVVAAYLGASLRRLGRPEEALRAFAEALIGLRAAGDKQYEAFVQRELAQTHQQLGRNAEQLACLREALRLDEEGEEDESARADLRAIAEAQMTLRDAAGALATFDRLVAGYAAAADLYREGDARAARARALELMGRTAESAREASRGQEQMTLAEDHAKERRANAESDGFFNEAQQRGARGDKEGQAEAWRGMLASARRTGFKNGAVIALTGLASYDADARRYSQARAEYTEAIALAREDGETKNEINAHVGFGITAANDGDFKTGLTQVHLARGLAAAHHDVESEIQALTATRILYGLLGDYPRMISCNEQMLAVARRSGRRKAVFAAEKFNGAFYEEIGDMPDALEHYRAESEAAAYLGDRKKIAEALNETAAGLAGTGDYDGARDGYLKSLAINDWFGGRVNLSWVYLYSGQPEKAAELLKPVNPNHILMGKYHLLKGDFASARELYQKVRVQEENAKQMSGMIAAETGLGLAEEGLSNDPGAAEHFTRAENLVDRQRDSLSPAHRLFYMAGEDWGQAHLEPFEGMVRIAARLPGGPRESFRHAEFTRGRLFAEAAARRYGKPETDLPPDRAEREKAAALETSRLAAAVEEAFRGNRMAEFRMRQDELVKIKARRDDVVAALRKDFPEYASVRYPLPLYPEETALVPGEVLIEYEVTGPYTKVFVVIAGRVAHSYDVKLARSELGDLVKRYRGYFSGVTGAAQLALYDPALGRRLYRLLLEPALNAKGPDGRPLIPAEAKLTIVPDEVLGILPFESLVVSAPSRQLMPAGRHGPVPVEVRYVGDERDVAYEYSATALTVARRFTRRAAPPDAMFILADPVFGPSDSRLRAAAGGGETAALTPERLNTLRAVVKTMGAGGARRGAGSAKVVGRDDSPLPRLDLTGALAMDLEKKAFAGETVASLTGATANKEELARRDLSRYRYIVFATHGLLDGAAPGLREPALALNQLGPGAGTGFLTMSEVMDLKLSADVVALTACQTGVGRNISGEGVMGLGRAFQYAGARSVLVSLWSVAEDSTAMLAGRFFAHLKEGKSKRAALRLARADVRRAGYEHPFYWAPFILIGGE
ncbi:MAG: CHAT domain-containing protein [Elusimicrobia bacterium]|nr:CHAT domain-containing protein [Elusimicrobiota bacterium]